MSYIRTFTGIKFAPLSPRLEDIDIRDIAHALSNLCRFTGHTPVFYSVAEHSVLVSKLVEPEYALGALLHDASEAYLNDIAGPIKPFFPEYVKAEKKLQDLIHLKWTIGGDDQFAAIKVADQKALELEQSVLFNQWDYDSYHPLVVCMEAADAEDSFLGRFKELTAPPASDAKSEEHLPRDYYVQLSYALA